jgi:hypothetical protein
MKALVVMGSIRESVTRRNVAQEEAPDIRLDSSREGSMDLNAVAKRRNRNGVVYCIMCQTTPPYE